MFFSLMMVVFACLMALSLWLWKKVCTWPSVVEKWGKGLSIGAWLFVFLFHLAFPYTYKTSIYTLGYGLSIAGYVWCVFLILSLPFFAVLYGIKRWRSISDIHMFMKYSAAFCMALVFSFSLWGFTLGSMPLSVVRKDFSFSTLPAQLDGYKIGQISDMHLGVYVSVDEFSEAIDEAARQGAKRLVITGDLVDEMVMLDDIEKVLKEKASLFPDGIDYIYGNHEHHRHVAAVTAMLKKTPVRILKNSHYEVFGGTVPFYIVGVDYPMERGEEMQRQRKAFMEEAMDGVPKQAFVLLLAHHPDCIGDGFDYHVPLTLAGHTHGGQLAIFGKNIFSFGYPYLRGTYRNGESVGYVNRGTGHWFPMRVGCSREVTIVELHKK